jgi:hypothetical protein
MGEWEKRALATAPRVPTHLVWAEVASGGTTHLFYEQSWLASPMRSRSCTWNPRAGASTESVPTNVACPVDGKPKG